MSEILSLLKNKDFFDSKGAAEIDDILNSESSLGVKFANDYIEYVKEYGAAMYYGHILTGVCTAVGQNVVNVTEEERSLNQGIPDSWYVIERVNLDGIVIWQENNGEVYLTSPGGTPKRIANSLAEYISL